MDIILTSVTTLLGAVLLFLISELMRGLFIKPMLSIRRHIGIIVDKIIPYIAELTNPGPMKEERVKEIRTELVSLASMLRAKRYAIVKYEFFANMTLVPSDENIIEAARQLTGLSNSFRVSTVKTEDKLYEVDYEHNVVTLYKLQSALGIPRILIDVDDEVIEKREKHLSER